MSCPKNELLTSGLLLNKDIRDKLVSISEELDKIPKGSGFAIQRDIQEKLMASTIMETVLDGGASSVAKASMLKRMKNVFRGQDEATRIAFLENLGRADISVSGNIAQEIFKYVDITNRDETFKSAKKALEKTLVFDYLSYPDSTSALYKSLSKDGVVVGQSMNRFVRERLMSMDDEELNKVLSGNPIRETHKGEVGKTGLEKGKVKAIDNILITNAVYQLSLEGLSDAIGVVRKLKSISDIEGLSASISKLIMSQKDLEGFQKMVNRIVKYIPSVSVDTQKEILKKGKELVSGNTEATVDFVARAMSVMKEPNVSTLSPDELVRQIDIINDSFIDKVNAVNSSIDILLGDPGARKFSGVDKISDDKLSFMVGTSNKEAFDEEVNGIVDLLKSVNKVRYKKGQVESIKKKADDLRDKVSILRDMAYNRSSNFLSDDTTSVLNYLTRGRYNYKNGVVDLGSVGFLVKDRGEQLGGRDKEIADLYETSYKSNTINIGNVQVFDDVDSIKKAIESGKVKNIILPSQDELGKKEVKDLEVFAADKGVRVEYPTSGTYQGTFIEDKGVLKFSSTDFQYIEALKNELLSLNMRGLVSDSGVDSSGIANKILEKQFGLQADRVEEIVEGMGFKSRYSIRTINRAWEIFSRINASYRQSIVDMQKYKQQLLENSDEQVDDIFSRTITDIVENNGRNVDQGVNDRIQEWSSSLVKEEKVETIVSTTHQRSMAGFGEIDADIMSRFFDDFDKEKAISNATEVEVVQRAVIAMEDDGLMIPYTVDLSSVFKSAKLGDAMGKGDFNKIQKKNKETKQRSNEELSNLIRTYYNDALDVVSSNSKGGEVIEGSGLYYIRDNGIRRSTTVRMPPDDLNQEAGTSVSKLLGSVEQKKKDVLSEIEKYKKTINELLEKKGEITGQDARLLKYELVARIRQLEKEIEKTQEVGEDFQLTKTFVFDTPSITSAENIRRFNERINELLQRYGGVYDEEIKKYSDILTKGETYDKNGKKLKSEEAFQSEEYRPILVGGRVHRISKDEELSELASKLPDGFGNIKGLEGSRLEGFSPQEKYDLMVALRTLNDEAARRLGLTEMVFREYGIDTSKLKNQPVQFNGKASYLPNSVVQKNTSDYYQYKGNSLFTSDEDLEIKEGIYKELSRTIKNGEQIYITPEKGSQDIFSLAKGFVEQKLIGKDLGVDRGEVLKNLSEYYTAEFAVYASLPKIDEDIMNDVIKYLDSQETKLEDLTPSQKDILLQLEYGGENLDTFLVSNVRKYPDILYKEEEYDYTDIQSVGGRTVEDKENLKNGVRTSLDIAEKNFVAEKMTDTYIGEHVRNNALQAQSKYKRPRELSRIQIGSLESGKIAEGELYLQSSKTAQVLATAWYIGTKSRKYDPKHLEDTASRFKEYMGLSTGQFGKIDGATLEGSDSSAYKLARHYRYIRERSQNITNDSGFNSEVYNQFSNVLDNRYRIDEATRQKVPNEGYLEGLASSLSQGNIFYGISAFEDRGMIYKLRKSLTGLFDDYGSPEGLKEFNSLFNSNYNIYDYRTIMYSLLGDRSYAEQLSGGLQTTYKLLRGVGRFATSPLMRVGLAFPGTFVSGIITSGGYLKAIETFRKSNVGFDMDGLSDFINRTGILRSSGGDIANLPVMVRNYIGDKGTESLNPVAGLRDEMSDVMSAPVGGSELMTQILDNGQNIYDALFARSLKNNAVASALKSEGFTSVADFEKFANNSSIPIEYRRVVYDRMVQRSYQGHEGMVNYIGSTLVQRVDNGSYYSKAAGFMNQVISPINFRGSLGINAMVNTMDNLSKVFRYGKTYGFSQELVEQLSKDPILKNWLSGFVRDAVFAAKMQNINNIGETSDAQETNVSDVMAIIRAISQNFQIIMTSGPMRIINASRSAEDNWKSALLAEYTKNFLKQFSGGAVVAELAVNIAKYGFDDGFTTYLENNLGKFSTGALRYMVGYINGVAVPKGSGIDTIFGGENELINSYYGSQNIELATRLERLGDGYDSMEISDFFKELLSANKIYRTVDGFFIDKRPVDLDISTVVGDAQASGVMKNFSKTGFYELPENADDDVIRYVLSNMLYKNKPGSSDWNEMVRNVLDGKGAYLQVGKGENSYLDREVFGMETLMGYMKEDGTLQELYNKSLYTNDPSRTSYEIADSMISYIDGLPEDKKKELPGADGMKIKIANTVNYDEYKKTYENNREKLNKRTNTKGKLVQGVAGEGIGKAIDETFIRENLPVLQSIYADKTIDGQTFSNLGLDLATYTYAKGAGEIENMETYYDIDEETKEVRNLKPKYVDVMKKLNVIRRGVASGKPISNYTDAAFGVWGVFPTMSNTKDGKEYDTEIMTKTMMYMNNAAKELGIDEDKRIEMITANMAFLGDRVLPVSDVRKFAGDAFADDYAKHLYQTFNEATRYAHGTIEDARRGYGLGTAGGGRRLESFAKNYAKFKEYVDNNAAEIYKPFEVRSSNISPYSLRGETAEQKRLSPPQIPSMPGYNAKSKKLFAAVKAKKSSIPTGEKKKKPKKVVV